MDKGRELGIDVRTLPTVESVHNTAAGVMANSSMGGQLESVTADPGTPPSAVRPPASSHDGTIVAAYLLESNYRHAQLSRRAECRLYDFLPIAAVRLSDASARAQGLKFRVNAGRTSD
ncbi:MAG: hypothetical protein ACJ8R9_25545 [Steroidobacteraceae bacterium]